MSDPAPQYIPVDLNPAATDDQIAPPAAPAGDGGDDPFLDDRFAPLDTRPEPGQFRTALEQIAAETEPAADPAPVPPVPPAPEPVPPAPEPAADEPVVQQFEDGSSLSIEKTNKGWKASLDSGIPGTNLEVFYGRTKDELLMTVARGKVHATRQIRKLSREVKLGTQVPQPTPAVAEPGQPRALTADDMARIKTQFTADPNAALEEWLRLRTGLTPEQLAESASRGNMAALELYEEGVAKTFLNEHPEYISTNENYGTILAWLYKRHIGRPMTSRNYDAVVHELARKGVWTFNHIEEAFTDLAEAGLLELERENPQPTPVAARPAAPVAPAATTAAPSPIATPQRTVRSRPGPMGISQRESTAPSPAIAPRSVSADDLDDLSDAEIDQLFTGVRRERIRETLPRRR